MKQLLILSGKGGTGKTTIATALIKLFNVKAFADCDVDAPNLHLLFSQYSDFKKSNYYGLKKAYIDQEKCISCGLCQEKCRFDAIYKDEKYYIAPYECEGCSVCEFVCPVNAIEMQKVVNGDLLLYRNEIIFSTAILKAGSGTTGLLVSQVKKQLFDNMEKQEDLVIIDGSPGIGCPVIASLSGVDYALMLTEPSISGLSDLVRVVAVSKTFNTNIVVCINKYDENLGKTKEIERFCLKENIPLIGKIPFDKTVIEALNNGKSVIDYECDATTAIINVFKNLKDTIGL